MRSLVSNADFDFSIPSMSDLRTRSGWSRADDEPAFLAVRRVYVARKVSHAGRFRRAYGPPFAEIDLPKGATGSLDLDRTDVVEETDLHETARVITESIDTTASVTSDISASVRGGTSIPIALEATRQSKISAVEARSMSQTSTIQRTVRRASEYRCNIKLDLPLDGTEFYIPTTWERVTYDVYLTHIDALVVDYPSRLLGFGRRRKHPENLGRFNPWPDVPNVVSVQEPRFRLTCWRFCYVNHGLIRRDDYVEEPAIADGVLSIEPIPDPVAYPVTPSSIPSLYSMAQLIPAKYDPAGAWC